MNLLARRRERATGRRTNRLERLNENGPTPTTPTKKTALPAYAQKKPLSTPPRPSSSEYNYSMYSSPTRIKSHDYSTKKPWLFRPPHSPMSTSTTTDTTTSSHEDIHDDDDRLDNTQQQQRIISSAESICNQSTDTRWVGNHKNHKKYVPKPPTNQNRQGSDLIYESSQHSIPKTTGGVSVCLRRKSKPLVAMPSQSMSQYNCIPSLFPGLPNSASPYIKLKKDNMAQKIWASLLGNNKFQLRQLLHYQHDTSYLNNKKQEDESSVLIFFGPPPKLDQQHQQRFFPSNKNSSDISIHVLVDRWVIRVPTLEQSETDDSDDSSGSSHTTMDLHNQFVSNLEDFLSAHDKLNYEVIFKLFHFYTMRLLQASCHHYSLAVETLQNLLLPLLVAELKRINDEKRKTSALGCRLEALIRFTRRNLAILYMFGSNFISARDELWQIIQWRSSDLVAHVLLGMSLCALGNSEDAIRVYLKTLVLLQRQPELDVASSTPNDKDEKVLPICSKLRRNKHKFAVGKVLNNMGCAFLQGGDYTKAKQTFERSLRVLCSENFDSLELTVYSKYYNNGEDETDDDDDANQYVKNQNKFVIEEGFIPTAFGQDVIITFCNLAHSHIKLKNYHDAMDTLTSAFRVSTNILRFTSPISFVSILFTHCKPTCHSFSYYK